MKVFTLGVWQVVTVALSRRRKSQLLLDVVSADHVILNMIKHGLFRSSIMDKGLKSPVISMHGFNVIYGLLGVRVPDCAGAFKNGVDIGFVGHLLDLPGADLDLRFLLRFRKLRVTGFHAHDVDQLDVLAPVLVLADASDGNF